MKISLTNGKLIFFNIISILIVNCPDIICKLGQEIEQNYDLINRLTYGKELRFCEDCLCVKEEYNINKENIFCLIKKNLYILGQQNKLLKQFDLSLNLAGDYFNIIPVRNFEHIGAYSLDNEEEEIDLYIYFIGNNNKINIFFYSLSIDKNCEKNINITYFRNYTYNNNITINFSENLSCQAKKNNEIICFLIFDNHLLSINCKKELNFQCNGSIKIDFNDYSLNSLNTKTVVKSSLSKNKEIILVSWQEEGTVLYYSFFYWNLNKFEDGEPRFFNDCDKSSLISMIQAASGPTSQGELGKFIVICKNENNLFNKYIFHNKNNFEKYEIKPNNTICKSKNQTYSFLFYETISNDIYNLTYYYCDKIDNITENFTNIQNSSFPCSIKNYNSSSSTFTITEETESITNNTTNLTILKKEDILQNLRNLLNNKEKEDNFQLSGDDFNLLINSKNLKLPPNSTHVEFSKCESILRNYYNISNSSYITFLQLELKNNHSKSLVNQVEYKVYDEKLTELNLSLCNSTYISIFYAIKDNTSINISQISSFKDIGVDIFNINDSFFTDICTSYSNSEEDLILEDRIKYIYQNYSLCEECCIYKEINLEYLTVECECTVKNNLTIVVSPLNLNEMIESPSGFEIIKCYNLVFSKNNKLNNYGFWLFSILLVLHIPLLILYRHFGISPLFQFILNQMVRYGYLKKPNPKDAHEADIGPPDMLYLKNKARIKNNNKKNPPKKNDLNNNNNKKENNENHNIKNELIDHSLDNKKSSEREINENSNIEFQNKRSQHDNNKIINNDDIKKTKEKKSKKKNNLKSIILNNSKNDFSKENIKNNISNNLYLNIIKTQEFENKTKNNNKYIEKFNKYDSNFMDFNLINININFKKRKREDYTPRSSNRILNNYTYEEAIEYDRRSLCGIFFIYLLSKQVLFHTFCFKSPLELLYLRIILLIFIISSDFALNAFFYFKDNISKKYIKSKNLILFSLSDNIGIIFLSTIIGFILLSLFTKLSNTKGALRKIFRNEEDKLKKDKNYVITEERKKDIKKEIESVLRTFKIKVFSLIIIELIFMLFFWYYVTAFCHVYQSTQVSWILDSLISMIFRIIIDLLICLGLAKLYRFSIKVNIECIYKICLFLYDFD